MINQSSHLHGQRLGRPIACSFCLLACFVFFSPAGAKAQEPAEAWQKKVRRALETGDKEGAVQLLTKAIENDPKNDEALYGRARLYDALANFDKAANDYGALLNLRPQSAELYDLRGAAYFKSGKVKESLRDFDKAIELVPSRAPYHWQRGISFYYAGMFAEGRKQFELHQTVNPNDVENGVWHFLCVARQLGVEKARGVLIPIRGDPRVPMTQIYDLFAGKGTADDVMTAAKQPVPDKDEARNRLFYAHLYLALYEEALGKPDSCREHLLKATTEYRVEHYMGDVARVHLLLMQGKK